MPNINIKINLREKFSVQNKLIKSITFHLPHMRTVIILYSNPECVCVIENVCIAQEKVNK